MKKKAVPGEPLKFEQALKRLEQIVEEMESGEVLLDDLLKKYEEGVKLAQFCQNKLTEAQQRIEILAKNKSGEIKLKPSGKLQLAEAADNQEHEEGERENEKTLF